MPDRPDGTAADPLQTAPMQEPATLPQPAPAGEPPGRAGRYRIEGEVARGSMGVVYRAADPELGRALAVKVLLPCHAGQPGLEARFLEEARVTAQLQHPGVPPVHELGRLADGRPFLAMRLVRGRTLAELLAERKSPAQDLPRWLGTFEQVCQTLAYAHSRGIIHRDVKPGNVMVGAFGEVQVMDWGLAKVLGPPSEPSTLSAGSSTLFTTRAGDDLQTQAGSVLGTPAYMAPEQARGELSRVDERSDVFGLGAVLCQVLTGRPPYAGEGAHRQARQADLGDAFARLDSCGADAELVALARRCLAPEPERRPRHAGEVAQAVAGYEAGVQQRLRRAEVERAAAQARAEEAKAKARAERRARRLQLGLAGAVLLAVVLAGGGWYWADSVRRAHEEEAARQREQAGRSAELALREAVTLRDEARKESKDLAQRRATLLTALSAVKRGQTLLANSPGAHEAVGGRLAELRREVEDEVRDVRMVIRTEEIRMREGEPDPEHKTSSQEVAFRLYAQAFRDYGIDVKTMDVTRAGRLIRERPIRTQLVAILDNWAWITPREKERRRLRQIADVADPDPRALTHQMRHALARDDTAALVRLAGTAPVAKLAPTTLADLGTTLFQRGKADEAVRLLQRAQRQYPDNWWINRQLGMALLWLRPPRPAEALRYLHAACALRSRNPQVYLDIGNVLHGMNRPDEALTFYRTAAELDPSLAVAQLSLGVALRARGRTDEAVDRFRRALKLDPKLAAAHNHLGMALRGKGRLDAAIACYRRAIERYPEYAEAHCNLGLALLSEGEFGEAIRALERGHELGSARPGWRYPSEQWLRYARQMEALDRRLPAVLGGKEQPRDAPERLLLAWLCQQPYRQLYVRSAKFYAEAFAEQPKLADDLRQTYRYNAACAAARAGTGQGKDGKSLGEEEKARWRREALDWLRAHLAAWGKRLAKEPAQANLVRSLLAHWQEDSDLAAVRDEDALARLPAEERERWQRLWRDVADLLKRADEAGR
jgi:eukaryotic-like serine/threonine-protein kinase